PNQGPAGLLPAPGRFDRRAAARRLETEPAGPAARAEQLLVGAQRQRWLVIRPRRFGPREEVHVDAPDLAGAKLDVAGAGAVVQARLLAAARSRNQRGRDGARRAFGEHASLWRAGIGDVSHRINAGVLRLQRARIDRDPAVLDDPAFQQHL